MPNKRGGRRDGFDNRLGWKFPGCLISGGVLIDLGDGKSKNYVRIANVKKRV